MTTKSATKKEAGQSLPLPGPQAKGTVFAILIAISFVHLFNDSIQSVIPAIFPILKESMSLSYTQIGWISFAINFTASIMQPVIGLFSDKRPTPAILPIGMGFTLTGMLLLAYAADYKAVLIAVIFVGLGSAAFHPEGSRVSHMAVGPRRGLAQSIFQVGGNAGQSLAPMLTSWIFIPLGQFGAIWFTGIAAAGIVVQSFIARWYGNVLRTEGYARKKAAARQMKPEVRNRIMFAMVVLILLVFVRSWYSTSVGSYYSFYLMEVFKMPLADAQLYIFLFLGAGALGTFFGGPLADRFGKRNMIFLSMVLYRASRAIVTLRQPILDGYPVADYRIYYAVELFDYGRICSNARTRQNRNRLRSDHGPRFWPWWGRCACARQLDRQSRHHQHHVPVRLFAAARHFDVPASYR